MYEKIEEFMFDIIGLLLPGMIFILLLVLLPILVVPAIELENLCKDNILILSNIINFYNSNKTTSIIAIIVAGYILGHTVKVFSKYPYILFEVIFDDGINKFVCFIFRCLTNVVSRIRIFFVNKFCPNTKTRDDSSSKEDKFSILSYIMKKTYRKSWDKKFQKDGTTPSYLSVLNFVGGLYSFCYYIIKSVFSFKSPSYNKDNENLVKDVVEKINRKYCTSFPVDWYSLYKFSNTIMDQEKIKSLSFKFLAKYNFYRSLSLIFLLNFVYIFYFFKQYIVLISKFGSDIYSTLMIVNFLLWFTFHEKFKRYWTLCGNEALMSLFYFISKPEKNDVPKECKKENSDEK